MVQYSQLLWNRLRTSTNGWKVLQSVGCPSTKCLIILEWKFACYWARRACIKQLKKHLTERFQNAATTGGDVWISGDKSRHHIHPDDVNTMLLNALPRSQLADNLGSHEHTKWTLSGMKKKLWQLSFFQNWQLRRWQPCLFTAQRHKQDACTEG